MVGVLRQSEAEKPTSGGFPFTFDIIKKKGKNMVTTLITIGLIILSVVLDQVSKLLVVANMELGQSIDVIPGIFRFTYIHNEGAAFGSMADSRWIFMILSSVAIIAILVYMFWKKPQSKLLRAALYLGFIIAIHFVRVVRTFFRKLIHPVFIS